MSSSTDACIGMHLLLVPSCVRDRHTRSITPLLALQSITSRLISPNLGICKNDIVPIPCHVAHGKLESEGLVSCSEQWLQYGLFARQWLCTLLGCPSNSAITNKNTLTLHDLL